MNEPDHYQTLGVVPDAEPAVIRAAYRALVAIYHPDRNGDSSAAERIRMINAAYEVLSDAKRKREYDAGRSVRSHSASSAEFDSKRPFSSSPIDRPWSVATEFYSHIDSEARDLEKLSWRLSFAFKLELLEGKRYSDASTIARRLKTEYLSRYFGTHKDVQAYAEELIRAGRRDAAIYLNEIVNVMGSSVLAHQIKEQVESRFTDLPQLLEARRIFAQISGYSGTFNVAMAKQLVELHGGTVKNRFLSARVDGELDGETYSFDSTNEFCQFVLKRYSAYA